MSLLVLENASIYFGDQTIFNEVSLRIGEGEKIGLPGRIDIEKRLTSIEQELMETDDVDLQMKLAVQLADLGEQLAHFEVFYSER